MVLILLILLLLWKYVELGSLAILTPVIPLLWPCDLSYLWPSPPPPHTSTITTLCAAHLDDNDIIPAPTPAPQQWKGQLQTESSCNCYHSIVLFPALLSHQHRAGWWQWKRWGGCLVVSGPLASTSQLGAAVTTLWLYNNSILIVMAATISSHKHSSHLNGAMPDISRHATLNFLFTEGRFTVRWK